MGVCRWTFHLPFRGSFSKRSTGRRVNGSLSLSTILYMRQPHATQLQKAPFALLLQQQASNSAPFAALHLNGVCRWTSQLPLRGSFSKRSTGQQVNGSNGSTGHILMVYVGRPRNYPWGVLFRKGQQVDGSTGRRVTFTLTILYMIVDDARLMTPHCKKHTVSFARSTGKFPSNMKFWTTKIINFTELYRNILARESQLWLAIKGWYMKIDRLGNTFSSFSFTLLFWRQEVHGSSESLSSSSLLSS